MNSRLLPLILLLSISAIHTSHGSTLNDTIDSKHWKIQKELLKEGHSKYLTTIYNKKDKLMSMFIWNRIAHLKENEFTLTQQIVNADSTKNMFAYSICNRADLKPIYHKTKAGNRMAAYNFQNNKIIRADSVVGNGVPADFNIESSVMPYNWELDIELLGILPYKSGESFYVNFYHPGSKQSPQYYEYKVIGTEPIKSLDNKDIPCWKVRIDYSSDSHAIFWISTKTKRVLQVKDIWGGGYRYKQLISVD